MDIPRNDFLKWGAEYLQPHTIVDQHLLLPVAMTLFLDFVLRVFSIVSSLGHFGCLTKDFYYTETTFTLF